MDWQPVLSRAVGVVAGGLFKEYSARQGSKELRQEADRLRRLTLKLIQVLDGAGIIEVKEWDSETGEPSKWPVGKSTVVRYNIGARRLNGSRPGKGSLGNREVRGDQDLR